MVGLRRGSIDCYWFASKIQTLWVALMQSHDFFSNLPRLLFSLSPFSNSIYMLFHHSLAVKDNKTIVILFFLEMPKIFKEEFYCSYPLSEKDVPTIVPLKLGVLDF